MRLLVAAPLVAQRATAGAALLMDGAVDSLPGLPGDQLLTAGSGLIHAARASVQHGRAYSSFLWPVGGRHAPDGHERVTVLNAADEGRPLLSAIVLLSPPAHLHGLTPRELEVLGLIIEGCSNREIARRLIVAARTVAAHLEHILVKLEASSRTLAAVRAEREGLYVPGESLHAEESRDEAVHRLD
ncbi:helix-turn-helix transcriptional regulator [Naasia lichenicola]|nr:LuxR C-terminal-related transcriptional regulator [Naasia lichenicola]